MTTPNVEISTEALVALAMSTAMQRKLSLGEDQAYVVAAAHYVDGQPPEVFQVVPGGAGTEGGGEGGQRGLAIGRKQTFTITGWFRFNFDQNGWSQEAMTRQAEGVLSRFKAIRHLFANTNLGMLLTESMTWVSETPTQWFDEELGVLRRDVTHSCIWYERLPEEQTITAADIA